MLGASLPTYTNIVLRLLSEVDAMLHNYVYNGYSALSGFLTTPLGIIAAIYVAILGYGITMGWVRASTGNFVKSLFKIGFIYMAVTNWSWVSQNVVDLVNSAISGMGDALIGASPIHIPGVGGIDGAMQTTLIQFSKLAGILFNKAGLSNLGAFFDGLIIAGFGYVIIAFALFEIILVKVMLAVLFVFTPLVVLFCYFKPFHPIFDRWLGAIVGFALLQLFVTAVLTLALSLAYWWVAAVLTTSATGIGNYGTLPIIIIGIVCVGLIFKAADLAQNLGGVVSTASGSALVGGMVGGMVGNTMSGLRLGKGALGIAGKAAGAAGGVAGDMGGELGGAVGTAAKETGAGGLNAVKWGAKKMYDIRSEEGF